MNLDHYQAARTSAVVFDLHPRGVIDVKGADAASYLHNLSTNDIKNMPLHGGCEAFFTTAKARTLAHVLIAHVTPEIYRIDLAGGEADKLTQHLNHYIVSEQVEVADRSRDFHMLRVVGPKALALLESGLGLPLNDLKPWRHLAGPLVAARRFAGLGVPAFDLSCPASYVGQLKADLAAKGIVSAADDVHEVLRIEAGWPVYGKDIDENRLVMEIGRTAQAISYTKGCFLGQEPIVMARDRGQVNRTLLGVMTPEGEPIATGAKLYDGADEVGLATSSARSPRLNKVVALAYLKRGKQDPGHELTVEPTIDGRRVLVSALPF
jgi:tRNA-modifying protein YgfZ